MGRAIDGKSDVSAVSRLSHTMPTNAMATPPTSSRAAPNRGTSVGTSRTTANITAVTGRKARPDCSGL